MTIVKFLDISDIVLIQDWICTPSTQIFLSTIILKFVYEIVLRKQVFFFDKNKIVSKMVEIL